MTTKTGSWGSRALTARARRVTMVLMDVDGVLTDGRITYYGERGEAKSFHVRDGAGVRLAHMAGLRTGVISGRGGVATLRRAEELKMDEIHLRVKDKLARYESIKNRRGLEDDQICFIGDDVLDLPLLARAGMPVAVADAHPEVLRRVRLVTRTRGGRGAVREVIDQILMAQGRWSPLMRRFAGEVGRRGPGRTRHTGRSRR